MNEKLKEQNEDVDTLVMQNERLQKNFKITGKIITNMVDLSEFLNELKCANCSSIPIEPDFCKKCGYFYCQQFLQSLKYRRHSHYCCKSTCYIENKTLPNLIFSLLNRIKFYCKYKEFGCPHIIMYGQREVHEQLECEYAVIKCPYQACELHNFRKDINLHKEVCQYKPFPCPYCHEDFYKDEIDTHKTNCSRRPVKCQWCKEQVEFQRLDYHEADCEYRDYVCEHCYALIKFYQKEKHSGIPCQQKQRNYYQRKFYKQKNHNEKLETIEKENESKLAILKMQLQELQEEQEQEQEKAKKNKRKQKLTLGGLRRW